MSDTAEYWFDKNSRSVYMGRHFYHIPGANCGHTHYAEAKQLGNVNCFACLELIKNGYEHGLKPGKYLTHGEKKRRVQQSRQAEFDKVNGKCSCGSRWTLRTNKITNEQFLGCLQYPKCKNTKSYIDNKVQP